MLWQFISRYVPGTTPENAPFLDKLVGYAVTYFQDFVKPTKAYRKASAEEGAALADLLAELEKLSPGTSAEDIQTVVYEVGKRHAVFPELRAWFQACYEILLGQDQGPRLGSFIALYGIEETKALLKRAVAGDDLNS